MNQVENRGAGGSAGTWNGAATHKVESGWSQGGSSGGKLVKADSWEGGQVVMSQPGSFTMQQGSMVATGMGQPVFIAQPAMQGTPVMMSSNMRQGDGRYSMSSGTVRRY